MASFLKIVAGTTGTERDQKLVSYLDFLAHKIPIEKITHLHVIKVLYGFEETNEWINEGLESAANLFNEEEMASFLDAYNNVNTIETVVLTGKVLPCLKEVVARETASLVALGKKEHGSSALAKNIIRKSDCNVLIVPENSKKTFTNILVPVDLSEHSGKLLDSAIAIQKQSPEIVFITCLHAYEQLQIPAYKMLRTEAQVRRDTRETVKAAFDKFLDKHRIAERDVSSVLIEEANNRPSQYVLNYINEEENNIDFVIMGTHGHTMIDAILGSTVERVISKNDKCPILIIK